MARRPNGPRAGAEEQSAETPPWMERDRAPRRVAPQADVAEPAHTFVSWRALGIGAALAVAIAIGLLYAVNRMRAPDRLASGSPGEVPLIAAPPTPYKTRVDDSASGPHLAGADPAVDAVLDSIPEDDTAPSAPLAAAGPPSSTPRDAPNGTAPPGIAEEAVAPPAAPAAAPLTAPKTTPRIAPPSADASKRSNDEGGAPQTASNRRQTAPESPQTDTNSPATRPRTVQLGAFSTRAKADAAWAGIVAATPESGRLAHRIEATVRDGRTLYRLRATGPASATATLCARLTATGAACATAR